MTNNESTRFFFSYNVWTVSLLYCVKSCLHVDTTLDKQLCTEDIRTNLLNPVLFGSTQLLHNVTIAGHQLLSTGVSVTWWSERSHCCRCLQWLQSGSKGTFESCSWHSELICSRWKSSKFSITDWRTSGQQRCKVNPEFWVSNIKTVGTVFTVFGMTVIGTKTYQSQVGHSKVRNYGSDTGGQPLLTTSEHQCIEQLALCFPKFVIGLKILAQKFMTM